MITRIFIFLFVMSCLKVLKELFWFVNCLRGNRTYALDLRNSWLLALSVGFIITILITGFNIN